jgi:hypothetical protein
MRSPSRRSLSRKWESQSIQAVAERPNVELGARLDPGGDVVPELDLVG